MNETTRIWTRFHQELRAFIAKTIRNQSDADDILQDIFLRIIRHEDKIGQAENLRNYLFGMVRNALADHFKKQKTRHDPLDETLAGQFSAVENDSLNATIADCCVRPFIGQLPEKYREALLLAELEEVPQKELALRLGISYSGAKSRVQRGREKLKERLLACCALRADQYGNLSMPESEKCDC